MNESVSDNFVIIKDNESMFFELVELSVFEIVW